MGKILSTFKNGYAGAIARSLDDVVVALANMSGEPLAFGVPVALASDGSGVVPFDPEDHTAASFVGVSVRDPAKTPDAYGSNAAAYGGDDIVDVLTRGHIVVALAGSNPQVGAPVAIDKTTGGFTVATGNTVIALTNVHVSSVPDTSGMAEILVNTRNVL